MDFKGDKIRSTRGSKAVVDLRHEKDALQAKLSGHFSHPCPSRFTPRWLWLLADESELSRNFAEATGLPPATLKH
jgi:hypothetical protein